VPLDRAVFTSDFEDGSSLDGGFRRTWLFWFWPSAGTLAVLRLLNILAPLVALDAGIAGPLPAGAAGPLLLGYCGAESTGLVS
jgi:hypothetical protein